MSERGTNPGSVSAVVVNYNAGPLLTECVVSLLRAGAGEVIVVDNASVDESVSMAAQASSEAYPDARVQMVQTGANLGFGRAVNLGAKRATGELLAICNPDCRVEGDSLDRLVNFLARHRDAGLVAPQIVDATGERYPSLRRFPSLWISALHAVLGIAWPNNPASRYYKSAAEGPLGDKRWASGAFLLMDRGLFADLGGFDDRYFMFLEDVELCRRIIARGYQIGFEPDAKVVHLQGASSLSRPYFVLAQHSLSLWRYADQTLEGSYRLTLPLVALGALARFGIGALRVLLRSGRPVSSRARR